MEKELKRTKKIAGITLIALVITIVVLIILAGVLINISLENNRLFNKAKIAKEQYTNAQEYEKEKIEQTSNEIDNYINSNRDVYTIKHLDYSNKVNLNSYSSENNKYTFPDDGYFISQGSAGSSGDNKIHIFLSEFPFTICFYDNTWAWNQNHFNLPVEKGQTFYYSLIQGSMQFEAYYIPYK